jgi:Domain of unknown function (DUF4136)
MTKTLFRRIGCAVAPLALLTISGCATPFRADVSRFQQLPPAQGQSFAIKAADPANAGGIEFGQYASLVAGQMQKLGYVASTTGSSDLTVTLGYNVDEGKERRVVREDPFYDPYWGYGGFGSFGHRGYYRPIRTRYGIGYMSGYYDPFLFGGYGAGYGGYDVSSFTVFTSGLDLRINRSGDGQSVFEGKAEAKSRSNKLAYLVPNLVEAMFTGFPGNSGETVRISVAPEQRK